MWKSSVLTVITACFLLTCFGQQLPDSLKQRNGTYTFYHNVPPPNARVVTDNINILYLNDSMFAFTCNSKNFVTGEWMGIGRLISFNGKEEWLGIVDWDRLGIRNDNKGYLDVTRVRTIQDALEVKEGIAYEANEYNEYVILKFFFSDTALKLDVLRKPGGRFHYDSIYIKKDNQKIDFTINKEYNWNAYSSSYDDHYMSTLISDCKVQDLPISEYSSITNHNWKLKKGDTVAICRPPSGYMQYLFVVKYGANYAIEKYGWLLRNKLTPLKRITVDSPKSIIIKTKIVNGVKAYERVDKPKQ